LLRERRTGPSKKKRGKTIKKGGAGVKKKRGGQGAVTKSPGGGKSKRKGKEGMTNSERKTKVIRTIENGEGGPAQQIKSRNRDTGWPMNAPGCGGEKTWIV